MVFKYLHMTFVLLLGEYSVLQIRLYSNILLLNLILNVSIKLINFRGVWLASGDDGRMLAQLRRILGLGGD